ncbi:MAG: RNA methyltransferase [Dehalococcoidia bacterium]|nr:RNA methyltransferase [Dehalococcoidia bacterium]
MAYNERLADRIRAVLDGTPDMTAKEMFGGICFMVGGKMACGVVKDDLLLRLDPDEGDRAIEEPHVRLMDFTGRPMRGLLYIAPAGVKTDAALRKWVTRSVAYAKSLPAKKARKKK